MKLEEAWSVDKDGIALRPDDGKTTGDAVFTTGWVWYSSWEHPLRTFYMISLIQDRQSGWRLFDERAIHRRARNLLIREHLAKKGRSLRKLGGWIAPNPVHPLEALARVSDQDK